MSICNAVLLLGISLLVLLLSLVADEECVAGINDEDDTGLWGDGDDCLFGS